MPPLPVLVTENSQAGGYGVGVASSIWLAYLVSIAVRI
jgi:hypothetical protein